MSKTENDTILVVDDEAAIRKSLKMVLEYEKYRVVTAASADEGLRLIEKEDPALVLLDIKMPGKDGIEVLRELGDKVENRPIVLISGHATVATAFEAARLGAYSVLEKPPEIDLLLLTVRNGVREGRLKRENERLKAEMGRRFEMVGRSLRMEEVRRRIERAGPTSATVLITGESGTGKELVARSIHAESPRCDQPFIQVNCAAMPEELIESELFGHERGSFTGAVKKQMGKFVLADKGTIFLDEVGDMSARAQAKVLRVLQEGEVEPVGAGGVLKVDVRVVAATNKRLEKEIEEGRFREDLYYRLNVIPIEVPPLRDRAKDIPLLLNHFLAGYSLENNFKLKVFSEEALTRLWAYGWPGNVRELRNTVERLVILSQGETIGLSDLPSEMADASPDFLSGLLALPTLREFKETAERAYIVAKLRENNWNVSRTAQAVKTVRSNLNKKIEQYGISQDRDG